MILKFNFLNCRNDFGLRYDLNKVLVLDEIYNFTLQHLLIFLVYQVHNI